MGVKQYDKAAQKLIAILVAKQAEVLDHPADLINVAIEVVSTSVQCSRNY
ncbi:MAG: hypothetical protein AAFR37_06775 [Cyanobacteria bacterium J06628_3]